eukprot:2414409-Rhodomonas_salina.1
MAYHSVGGYPLHAMSVADMAYDRVGSDPPYARPVADMAYADVERVEVPGAHTDRSEAYVRSVPYPGQCHVKGAWTQNQYLKHT